MEFDLGGTRLVLEQGDITRSRTDAIANAANGALAGGGGVDGAIHRAAGPRLMAALDELRPRLPGGRLATGQSVITPGFGLPARWIIHCVGPVYTHAGARAAELLASCYVTALGLCREHAIDTVAFPSISTGVYGYPVDEAALVALSAVQADVADRPGPRRVVFVLFDAPTLAAYRTAAQRLTQ
jgi:O-acetyl-ADP-ribose deacetylase (regulator of RNase III)